MERRCGQGEWLLAQNGTLKAYFMIVLRLLELAWLSLVIAWYRGSNGFPVEFHKPDCIALPSPASGPAKPAKHVAESLHP